MRGFRPERVGSLLREVLSETICFRLQDPRIEPMTSITRVEVTGDLMFAKVFLSVPGGEVAERRTLAAIEHAGGYLQRIAAGELHMRHTPQLSFGIDKSAKIARETLQILQQNRIDRGEPAEEDARKDDAAGDTEDDDQGLADETASTEL